MQSSFREGWDTASERLAEFTGSFVGDRGGTISRSIQILQDDINAFKGNAKDIKILSGDIAEPWHGDTANISAAQKGSTFWVRVPRSNVLGSPDIESNTGDLYSLKYLRTGAESAKAQAKSIFERFKEYQANQKSDISFEDYLKQNGISDADVLNDPIYSGQIRIIPADQYDDAVAYLKWKIAKESVTRPELVAKYQDALDNLDTVVRGPDGVTSAELSKMDAQEYARLAKEGKFQAYDTDFTPKDSINFNDIVGQGLKAGATAAIITFVMKMGPGLIDVFSELIKDGTIDDGKLRKLGSSAIPASAESFLRGFVAASLTFAYESGKFGNILKGLEPKTIPGVIGALTVIVISTIKDSVNLVQGRITYEEFFYNLNKNVFVTGCAVGLGIALQSLIPALPCAYFIGNIVGTLVGSMVFSVTENLFMALCVRNGYTMFGLVNQDYSLPDEVLKDLGIDWSQVDSVYLYMADVDEVQIDENIIEETQMCCIKMLRRGVFSIRHVGYYYD